MQYKRVTRLAAAVALTLPVALSAQAGAVNQYGNPPTLKPAPTTAAITVRDLQTRLYQFADDSMMGRQVGTFWNQKGTDFIAAEVKRLGLLPGGDNGTYFQVLPYHLRKYTANSKLTVDGNPLVWNNDFVAVAQSGQRAPRPINNAQVIFGGVEGDTVNQLTPAQVAGKVIVLLPANRPAQGGMGGFARMRAMQNPFTSAAAVARIDLDALSAAARVALNEPQTASMTSSSAGRGGGAGGARGGGAGAVDSVAILRAQLAALEPQAQLRITRQAASKLFKGASVDQLAKGQTGGTVNGLLEFVEVPTNYGRNVVAIIPGSDPALRHEYVAIGAHNDHVGRTAPVDKDSIKAYNDQRNRLVIANGMVSNAQLLSQIHVNMDSIRKVHPKPRIDTVNNGADDDGSGSMAVLEIAEAIAAMPVKPKRSTLFVWHTGEEAGLLGAAHFTRNPTVSLDSVVAQINIDMIGRGRAGDLPGGGPDYLGVVGSFFDSKDLGETVAAVNKKLKQPFNLDYRYDEPISWQGYNNIYGRSDHYHYALAGIPIAFFFTGLHGDYHQPSDEPEFIDYPHYTAITNYLKDLLVEVGNGPRPRMNGSRPAKPVSSR